MSEKAHLSAIVALLNAASPSATGYSLGDLALLTAPPEFYNEVLLAQKVTEGRRLGGPTGMDQFRLLTRAVGHKYPNAQEMRDRARLALEGKTITIDGVESTPIERALADDPIAADDGWWSGISEWSYSL